MLALRVLFAITVTAAAVVLLATGLPLGAIAVLVLGVWLRRAAESGRLSRSI